MNQTATGFAWISGCFRRIMALVISGMLLITCGCKPQVITPVEERWDEPVANLKAIILGTPPAEGLDELYRQLDELTIPELNCTLRFEYIPWGDERVQLNMAAASGEYDFIPSGVFSDYRALVSKNAFLNLNDYLDLVPDLQAHYATYSDDILESCEINGGLYGIPQYSIGIHNTDEGFFFREDLRKEWGLEPITDLETMEAYLYRAKQTDAYRDNPLITDNRVWTSLWLLVSGGKYLEIDSMLSTPFVVVLADDPSVLVKRMETPEFQTVAAYLRKWREAGILESNMLALSDNEGTWGKELMIADLKPCETNVPFWSINTNFLRDLWDTHPDWEYSFFPYCRNHRAWYIESIADASVISVSAKTQYPETAVKLLEKIHTDQRYYDLLRYGVEGIHYNLVDGYLDYTDIPSDNSYGWTPITDFMLSRDIKYVSEKWYEEISVPYDAWQEEVSQQAVVDPLGGFSTDMTNLETVAEDMEEVRRHYFLPILCGYYEDVEQALDEANEMLRQAGFDEYFDSMQRQITEYFNSTQRGN